MTESGMMDAPSQESVVSVESKLAAAQRIKDPIARAQRLVELLETATTLRKQVSAARDEAVAAAMETAGLGAVGDQLGLSKTRIRQIVARVAGDEGYQVSGSRIGKKPSL